MPLFKFSINTYKVDNFNKSPAIERISQTELPPIIKEYRDLEEAFMDFVKTFTSYKRDDAIYYSENGITKIAIPYVVNNKKYFAESYVTIEQTI